MAIKWGDIARNGRRLFGFLTRAQAPFIVPVKKQSNRMKAKPPMVLTIAVAVKYAKGRQGKRGVENPGYVVGNLHVSV
jgi:hypothetical protein